MEITPLLWGITIAVIVGLLAFDYLFHVRKAHLPTIREAAIWSAIYVGIALLFGLMFFAVGDTAPDLRILLDLAVETGLASRHRDAESVNRIDRAGVAFHERVRQAYRQLARELIARGAAA